MTIEPVAVKRLWVRSGLARTTATSTMAPRAARIATLLRWAAIGVALVTNP
jgi:hypothetical protein